MSEADLMKILLGLLTLYVVVRDLFRDNTKKALDMRAPVEALNTAFTAYKHEQELAKLKLTSELEMRDQRIDSKFKGLKREMEEIREENGLILSTLTSALSRKSSTDLAAPKPVAKKPRKKRADESDG